MSKGCPSLYQVIKGNGVPLTGQDKTTEWNSIMLVLFGVPEAILGAS